MQFVAVFPTTPIGKDPAAACDFALAAEDLDDSRIVVHDHVLGAVHADRGRSSGTVHTSGLFP